jgi:periplasmic protein TonB
MPASQALQPAAAKRSPRFVSVGLVAALHVLVIYALLIGIHVVPNPVGDGPIHFRPLPPSAPTSHPPLPVPSPGPLLHPPRPTPPTAPIITIEQPPPGPTIGGGNNLPVAGGSFPVPGPTLAARGIAETHTIPPYPMLGIRLGHEGTVRLAISLDEGGNVVSAQVERSSGYQELDAAAVMWVRSHWRYQPAMRDGQRIPATVPAMVTFRLDQIRG